MGFKSVLIVLGIFVSIDAVGLWALIHNAKRAEMRYNTNKIKKEITEVCGEKLAYCIFTQTPVCAFYEKDDQRYNKDESQRMIVALTSLGGIEAIFPDNKMILYNNIHEFLEDWRVCECI